MEKVNQIFFNERDPLRNPKKTEKDKSFIELFKNAYGKTHLDVGWEDSVIKNTIPGHKNLDKNVDGRIDTEDLKLLYPNKANVFSQIHQLIGKKEGDYGWQDTVKWVWKRSWWGWWGWWGGYPWMPVIIPGAKHYDYNKDKRIDIEDIKALIPDVKVKEAYGKTHFDVTWEDKVIEEVILGYKNADINNDGKVDSEDKEEYITSKFQDNVLIKEEGKEEVYLLQKGKRYSLADPETKDVLGFPFRDIKEIPKDEFSFIDDGGTIKLYRDGTLLKDDKDYYIVMEGKIRRFQSEKSLNLYGFSKKDASEVLNIKNIPKGDDMQEYPDGILIKTPNGPSIYSIIEGGKRRSLMGGLDIIQEMGLGEKKNYTIKINASPQGGFKGIMGLMIDGKMIKEWNVQEETKTYEVTIPLSEKLCEVDVVLLKKPESGTSLKIESIEVDKNVYSSTNAYIDDGSDFNIQSFTDNNVSLHYDNQNSRKDIKELKNAGAVRFFNIPIEKPILLSQEELEKIEEGGPIYNNGTLVQRDDGDPLFVIYQGKRYLIKNNPLTLKLYGLDKNPINKIGDIVYKIPQGESRLPLYPEKSLIKTKGGTYQVILDEKRYTIDKETRETMGAYSIERAFYYH